jgi:hypothetical protein
METEINILSEDISLETGYQDPEEIHESTENKEDSSIIIADILKSIDSKMETRAEISVVDDILNTNLEDIGVSGVVALSILWLLILKYVGGGIKLG